MSRRAKIGAAAFFAPGQQKKGGFVLRRDRLVLLL